MWTIYILSVKQNTERREHVERAAHRMIFYGFHVIIVDAYYWKTVNVVEQMLHKNITFSNVSQSQIGCFLSHRLAWSFIVEKNDNRSIILEDDMDLENIERFFEMEKSLNENASSPTSAYDGVIMWKHPDKIPSTVVHVGEHFIEYYKQWGLCAYYVSPHLCKQMLLINHLDQPIDDYLYEHVFPLYKIVFTKHNLFVNLGYVGGYTSRMYQFSSLITE